MLARIVPDVVREHAELAAFQWAQRDTLSQEDPPDPAVIAGVDRRLEANLDGLRIAGAAAWPFIIDQYEDYPEKGELFVVAVMALEQQDERRIAQAVAFARNGEHGTRGLCGAFEWLPPKITAPLVRIWIDATDPVEIEAALAAFTRHRAVPGNHLPGLLTHAEPAIRRSAAGLVALAGRQDCAASLRALMDDPDPSVCQAAAEALVGLGHREGEPVLKARVIAMDDGWQRTLRLLASAVPRAEFRAWLSDLIQAEATKPIAVRGAGMLEDLSLLPWIAQQASHPALAEASGAALIDLRPDLRSEDDLWSLDPEILGEKFSDYFGGDIPLVPVAGRLSLRLRQG